MTIVIKSEKRHFSFDLDGTLVDSIKVMKIAWTEVREQLDIDVPFSVYQNYIGLPFDKIMRSLDLQDSVNEIKEIYFNSSMKNHRLVNFYPDAITFLGNLRGYDKYISIITSKPRLSAENLLSNLGFQPDLLICGDDSLRGKPDQSVMLEALDISNSKVSECIYFGDMFSDFVFSLNSEVDYIHLQRPDQKRMPSTIRNNISTVSDFGSIVLSEN